MRILTIVHGFHPLRGGAETAALEIAVRTAGAGAVQTVLTAGLACAPGEETVRGVRILRAPMPPRGKGPTGPGAMLAFVLSGLPTALRLGAEQDIVHAHFGIPAGLLARIIRRRSGTPYLVTLPGSDVPGYNDRPYSNLYKLSKPVLRSVWRHAARLAAVSEDLRAAALHIEPGVSIDVIPSGVDVKRFERTRGMERQAGRILVVGRLIPLKGHNVFLDALARVKASWSGPLTADILGQGPELENLRRKAAAAGLSNIVNVPGFVSDEELRKAYATASLFVMSSINDAAPLTVLEAMASGLPIVATAVGGVPESLSDRGAVFVKAGDAEAMAGAIHELLGDAGKAEAMGRENRTVVERFDWDIIAGRYLGLYEEIVRGAADE